jgi:TRAP-type C4-dicarboxylate transport system substrate-binding protein
VFEIGYSTQSSYGGVFPGSSVVDLPFHVKDITKGAVAFWNLYENGTLAEEYRKMKPLALYVYPSSGLQTRKPIKTMEDLRGMKIATQGIFNSKIMEKFGAAPITLTTTENYQALQRGLVEGVMMGFTGFTQFKLQEVTNHHLVVAFGTPAGFTSMNKEAYERLPERAKAAVDKNSGRPFSARMGAALAATADLQFNQVKAMPDHHFSTLEPNEFERWRRVAVPLIDEWVKATPDGAKILAAYRAEVAREGAGF